MATPETLTEGPLPFFDRIKSAASTLLTGKAPSINPLSEEPEDKTRAALVKELNLWVVETRAFWKPLFDRIKNEQKFACGKQWPADMVVKPNEDEPYVGDVVQQMINRKTATLYAKNPTPEANRRETMPFVKWDGKPETIKGAMATVQQANAMLAQATQLAKQGVQVPMPGPEVEAQVAAANELIQDYQQGMMRKALMEKIAKTATLLIKKEWELQSPDLLVSMKQLVTRVLTSRVGYIKVLYRRELESLNTVEANETGLADDMEALKHSLARMQEPDFDKDGPEAHRAAVLLKTVHDAMNPSIMLPADEGVVYDFLTATSVIVDRNCRCLREFIGAKRIVHEVLMTVEDCEKKFGISLRDSGAVLYSDDGTPEKKDTTMRGQTVELKQRDVSKVCVWEVQDKPTGAVYTLIDGVKDFIKDPEPNEPNVKRFWTIVPVVFNCQEVETNDPEQDITIYPRSDIRLAMPMQIDINVAGQGLREHRIANRPWNIAVRSKFAGNTGEADLMKLGSPRKAFDVICIDSLNPSEKLSDFVQPGPMQTIDPKMYDPAPSNQAMMLATGMQPADIGAQRPDERATGQRLAAQGKAATDESNIADLDFALSTVAQMTWEMLIQEMPSKTVKKLIGAGAVWPDLPAERLNTMNEIALSIEAGSSGRPNQMHDVENFKVISPQLAQMMVQNGNDLTPLIKEGVRRLGDKLDVDDFIKPNPAAQAAQAAKNTKAKPPSISAKLHELTPDERAQALGKAGIKATRIAPPQQMRVM